jgi:alanine racemase
MINRYTTDQIALLIKATLITNVGDLPIQHILLDSRKLLFPETSLFFALDGPRRNGNAFIEELYHKGVRNFVVGQTFSVSTITLFPSANFLQVKDVMQALHLLVTAHRLQFQYPVIGITGSNGKTIVKEWLYQLLHEQFSIVRNPKSYNSQIGVPLSVWQMHSANNLGIFEAGISQPGEMDKLEKMIHPTIGILTNIGEAHNEGFLNIRQKINEKLKLFVACEILIYSIDNPDVNETVNIFVNQVRGENRPHLFTWSKKSSAAVLQITEIHKQDLRSTITSQYQHTVESVASTLSITIPFIDEASVENAINAWCVMLQLNINPAAIQKSMAMLKPVEMRLELKQGINNCSVINDSYSADVNSLTIALDFLSQQHQHPNRTLILSDILQSGKSGRELYHEVAEICNQQKINRLIGVGPEMIKNQAAFQQLSNTHFFASTDEFKQHFHALHFYNETILLKGARVFEFEQISHLLEAKVHQTVLEINLNAVTHNLKTYQQLLNPGVKLMAMVKAFSYGSGSFEIASLLQFHKVDYLAVAYADEGVELRKAGITLPIMVMNPETVTFDVMVHYNLEPEIYSFNLMNDFNAYLQKNAISHYPIHLKLDTGMHRLGFEAQDMDQLIAIVTASSSFKIQSVFSHLVASDNAMHDDFTRQQAQLFLNGCHQLSKALGYPFIKHIANTSAIHRHHDLQLDMVRLGIGLYGVDSYVPIQQQLLNVTTLKTTIAQVRSVKAGDTVGYSRKGIAEHNIQVATVRIGYADGYLRRLGNGVGSMLLNGQLVPVIGNVCMDMTMLNVTGVEAKEGDEVLVFGAGLPVQEVARQSNTIAYEILAGVSQRVKRVYYEE